MLTKKQKENRKKLCEKAFKLRWEAYNLIYKGNRKEARKIFFNLLGAHTDFDIYESKNKEEEKQKAIKLIREVKRTERYLEDMRKKIKKIHYHKKIFPGEEKIIETPEGLKSTFEEFESEYGTIAKLEIKE